MLSIPHITCQQQPQLDLHKAHLWCKCNSCPNKHRIAYDAQLHSAVAAYGRLQRYVQQHAYLCVLIHVAYKLHQSTVFGLDKIKYHQQSIGASSKLSDQ